MNRYLSSPTILLILLLALLCASAFHFWRGKRWTDLGMSLLAALMGMVVGQIAGDLLDLGFARIGRVYVIEGTAAALILMLAVAWLRG